ncbi:hypothetical protein RchiOBHm_Chr6g0284911 [Rosa chinensis]|uniref:Uncharacterized protein n=1 Tax=Rosa chinensis TaxID=74649 RepID=A0A2P6PUF2_ROSCH|nr:hypothetical protein RchiOBHm_Chr6g0284911 [Rosa chinensis]
MGKGFEIDQIEPLENYPTVLIFATGYGTSPIGSLIESGFNADKRSDVKLFYGIRNLDNMAYQITWQWLPFTNSAQKDDLKLYHWVNFCTPKVKLYIFNLVLTTASLPMEYVLTLYHLVSEYPAFLICLSLFLKFLCSLCMDVIRYTDEEYEKYLTDPVAMKLVFSCIYDLILLNSERAFHFASWIHRLILCSYLSFTLDVDKRGERSFV